MAKLEFLRNLRRARNLFAHRVQVDSPALDADAIARRLASVMLWLTPSVVEGFDAGEFHELPMGDRDKLEAAVARFAEIAGSVPPDRAANDKQILEGTTAFEAILAILHRHLELDRESDSIRRIIASVSFPPDVLTWEFEIGADSTGDPAVWLWIIVNDALADKPNFSALTANLQEQIRREFREGQVQHWPYIRFRTASEQQALMGEAMHEPLS